MRPKCARVEGNSGLGEGWGAMRPKSTQVRASRGRLGKGGREKGEDKKARVEGNLAGIDKGVHIRERRAEGKRLKSEWQERVE